MSNRWDVIIVGARIAGSTLAAYLGKAGLRVLLLERAKFPADHPQQGSWEQETAERWQQLGVFPKIEALGAPKRSGHYWYTEDVQVPYSYPEGVFRMTVRRVSLDNALAEFASSFPTVEFRDGFNVKDLLWEGDRVVGITGSSGGETIEERAPLVVGADGRYSMVARHVNPETYETVPSPWGFYIADYSNVKIPEGMAYYVWSGTSMAVVAPVDGGMATTGVGVRPDEMEEFKAGLPDSFEARVRKHPVLSEVMSGAVRETKVAGAFGLSMYKRVPYGPGWALLGDAGYHLDPMGARGTTAAVASAELMQDAITSWLAGKSTFDEALSNYQQRRDETLTGEWMFTKGLLALGTPGEKDMLEARVLAADPELRALRMRAQARLAPMQQYVEAMRAAMQQAGKAEVLEV